MRERTLLLGLCASVLLEARTISLARADEPTPAKAEATSSATSSATTSATTSAATDAATSAKRAEHETYSPYEKETIKNALEKLKAEVDHEPEGKIIEGIDVVRLEVIEDRDPAPNFLNWFHWTSLPYVIEQEILTGVGRPYSETIIDETARNLRGLGRLSLVLCFATKGTRPDRVRVIVITKDTWSLRLNSDFRFAGGRLETLLLQPSEENIFGTHNSIALQVTVTPAAYSVGGRYAMPRIGGSRIKFSASANVIMNRELGVPEGSYGSFLYGQPLYSTQAKWSWGATLSWRDEISRRYCPYDKVTPCVGDLRAYDAVVTKEVDPIPFNYRSDVLAAQDFVTRSFGTSIKHDVTVGFDISRRRYRDLPAHGVDPAAQAEFVDAVLPISDTRVSPFVQYETYSTEHKHMLDYETLALTEDVKIGHDLILKLAPAFAGFGSTRTYLSVYAAARYSVALGSGLALAFAESSTDIAPDSLPDASIEAGGRVATPRLGIGRLVVDGRVLHRYRNYHNTLSALGGSTRLRGYPTQAFLGKDVVTANLEFRSRPIEILSCQLAGVAFFDAGDAFNGAEDFHLKQSAGFGVRVLFPQFDRTVIRLDWGFPLTRGYREPDALPGDIVVTFRQAFPEPDVPTAAE